MRHPFCRCLAIIVVAVPLCGFRRAPNPTRFIEEAVGPPTIASSIFDHLHAHLLHLAPLTWKPSGAQVKRLVDAHIESLRALGQKPKRVWGVTHSGRSVTWTHEEGWHEKFHRSAVNLSFDPLDVVYIEYVDPETDSIFGRSGVGYQQNGGEIQLDDTTSVPRRITFFIHNGSPRVGLHEWSELRFRRLQHWTGLYNAEPHDLAEQLHGRVPASGRAHQNGWNIFLNDDPDADSGIFAFASDNWEMNWSPAARRIIAAYRQARREKRFEEAAQILSRARHTEGLKAREYERISYLEGKMWLEAYKYDNAISTFKSLESRARFIDKRMLMLLLGETLMLRGAQKNDSNDFKEAYQTLRSAEKIQPTLPPEWEGRFYYDLGTASLELHRFKEAEESFMRALDSGLAKAKTFLNLAFSLKVQAEHMEDPQAQRKTLQHAMDVLTEGIRRDPNALDRDDLFLFLIALSLHQYDNGNNSFMKSRQGVEAYRRELEGYLAGAGISLKNNERAEIHARVGLNLMSLFEFARAKEEFLTALQWDKNNQTALDWLRDLEGPSLIPFASDHFQTRTFPSYLREFLTAG